MARPQDTPRIPQGQAVGERQEQAKEVLDKRQPTVKDLPQTEEERPPARVIGDMLNHRRMLKGMLDYTEAYLRQHGRKV